MISRYRNIKHLRLAKWGLYSVDWLICPGGPLLYLTFFYKLYEKVSVNKFTFIFIAILVLAALCILKGVVRELQLKDAHSDGEYTARFIMTAVYKSLLLGTLMVACIFAARSLSSFDTTKIENIKNMIMSILYICLFKFVQIWFHHIFIDPLEVVLKERQAAYHLSNIQAQQGFYTDKK